MMRGVERFEAFARDVGVDLRRRDVGMAEQQLDDAEVGAVVEQVGGEGVAQDVRRQLVGGDGGLQRVALDQLPEGLAGHRGTAAGDEQGRRSGGL